MEVNPLSIILVKKDSKGDRLLFRYPFQILENSEPSNTRRKNPYTLPIVEDLLQSPPQPTSNIKKGQLTGFTDEVLSSLFAVKPELCNKKFELKVNDVRFVSHPTLVELRNQQPDDPGIMLINIVFALQALASHSVVKCYHDLSKRIGIALKHEERRCGFVSEQIQTMTMAHDHDDGYLNSAQSPFRVILDKCSLAKNLRKVYDDLCSTGLVNVRINRWIPLTFCLPQKVHQWHLKEKIVEPEDINRCLRALRPYHSLLLLYPIQHVKDFISLDGSPSLMRMLTYYSPLKNLQSLADESDLTLNHVFELTAHLVYWAKATVIFPICTTNKYVISPNAPIHLNSPLIEKFNEAHPGTNLLRALSDFSLPTSLGQKVNPLCHPSQQSQLVQTIIWMLQHHLLLQLHTYILYIPTDSGVLQNPKQLKQKSPSPKNGNPLVNSTHSDHSKTDSGSNADSSELTSKSINLDNISFSTTDDEKQDYQEELLLDFSDEERSSIFKIPATNNPEDLKLFAKLCRKEYFQGNHHIEEIMYLENLRRSQLLQLLDKFRDVLITYESEDPAIAMFSCSAST